MPDPMIDHESVVNAIQGAAGRSTLAFEEAVTGNGSGTAFWFNDLVDATPGKERIRQYLLTASALTQVQLAEFHLRDELADPDLSAEHLLMKDFSAGWTRFDGLGVAAMATGGLHAYATRKQWRWTTDEITHGLAANDTDIAMIGSDPVPAYVLGHVIDESPRSRPKAIVVGSIARDADQTVRWDREIPHGCVGAPVFTAAPLSGDSMRLLCVGIVLPGNAGNVIATFDAIRSSVRTLSPDIRQPRWPWQRR